MESKLGYYPAAELIFGIVSPIGVDYRPVVSSLENFLKQFGYRSNLVKISDHLERIATTLGITSDFPANEAQIDLMKRKIDLGDKICARTQEDALAYLAIGLIAAGRQKRGETFQEPEMAPKTAHVIISLKRPEEVDLLRRVYGSGFFLIGIAAGDAQRKEFFKEHEVGPQEQLSLIETDAAEQHDSGQHTRDTFYLSDVFVSLENHSEQIRRLLDLIFGNPFETPTLIERSMYLAYASSLSSGDLARQVGAALVDEKGDCLGLGWNDVPKAGGGLYGPEDEKHRDKDREEDTNDVEKFKMAEKIIRKLRPNLAEGEIPVHEMKQLLSGTGFFDITEFGRAVHAEMAAILACARTGHSPINGSLFVTTFPCHNCTRHIIASGIKRVYYIEPYAKSKALQLHDDACTEKEEDIKKIPFLPFIGIGPRRFLDLFSLKLSSGYPIERKENGKKVLWGRRTTAPRLQMAPVSYLTRERLAAKNLTELLLAAQHQNDEEGEDHAAVGRESLGDNQPNR
ncbi:MAG: anti-phage dCTP deaminase [Terracidiphilus sp.]|nr:anti-phage dCTP deaminase [Terracidiphilus sp.]